MGTKYLARRRFLGAAGAVATSVPFVKSWQPSAGSQSGLRDLNGCQDYAARRSGNG